MSTPTFQQWMDYLDTGTQPEPKLAFNTTLYPTFLNTNFALHRWQEIYISKFAWICQRLKPFFCARFHSHSPWAPVSAPFARSLPESKWVYSATIMFVCFRLWTLFVCLFVCLFASLERSSRPPGVNVAALSNSAHQSSQKLQPELMDESACSLPLQSFVNGKNPKSWFDSCVSNELLMGDGTGEALYDKDTKWCQRAATPPFSTVLQQKCWHLPCEEIQKCHHMYGSSTAIDG